MKPQVSIGNSPLFKHLTNEQGRAAISSAKTVQVKAPAGSGKTSGVMIPYACARPRAKGLYMVFGKSVQEEANKKLVSLGVNTRATTQHALAYPSFGRSYQNAGKLGNSLKPALTSELLGCNFPVAAAINETLTNFMSSADKKISEDHLPDPEVRKIMATQSGVVMDGAQKLWARMTDINDRDAKITHDTYLKLWSMTDPRLDCDFILFDECQDANPLSVHLVNNQTHASRVYVGDPHQSIYGFRGAKNLMSSLEVEERHVLTRSFRFTPAIGVIAQTFLAHWKNEKDPLIGCGRPFSERKAFDDHGRARPIQTAYLARTVAGLIAKGFELQQKGERIEWVKGLNNYRVNSILEAHKLFTGDLSGISDPTLKMMPSWYALEEYVEASGDGEAGALFKLVSKYKNEIPNMVDLLRKTEASQSSEEPAKFVLTTAHQAKGLEWDYVKLCPDFYTFKDRDGLWQDPRSLEEQEINLMYVALTRAMYGIAPTPEMVQWFQHQAATKQFFQPKQTQEKVTQKLILPNEFESVLSSSPRAA